MRNKSSIYLALLVLLSLLTATVPAQAVFFTRTLGGTGGGNFREQCDYSSALVGVVVVHSKDWNSVNGVCQILTDGHPVGAGVGLQIYGDPNISGRVNRTTSTSCSDDMVIYGLVVQASNVGLVHRAAALCRNLTTGATKGGYYTSEGYGGESANEDRVDCGANGYAVGLLIHSGTMVDAVGLICDTWTAPAKPVAPPPPPPTPPPPPQPKKAPPLPINNNHDDADNNNSDDGNGDNGNGNGGGGQAVSDGGTTIYKQPNGDESDDNIAGYVDPGGTVTGVSCDDSGFCHINQPANGYVWHEDIGR